MQVQSAGMSVRSQKTIMRVGGGANEALIVSDFNASAPATCRTRTYIKYDASKNAAPDVTIENEKSVSTAVKLLVDTVTHAPPPLSQISKKTAFADGAIVDCPVHCIVILSVVLLLGFFILKMEIGIFPARSEEH